MHQLGHVSAFKKLNNKIKAGVGKEQIFKLIYKGQTSQTSSLSMVRSQLLIDIVGNEWHIEKGLSIVWQKRKVCIETIGKNKWTKKCWQYILIT